MDRGCREIPYNYKGATEGLALWTDAYLNSMPASQFLLPIEFDLAATFLMALTGVWAASRRGYDVVGAFTLAFLSSVGGGLLRDSVFLVQPPAVLQTPFYLAAVLAAVLVGGLFYRFALRFERLVAYVDALALGVYGVVGTDKALVAGIGPLGALLVGMVNAVGGGLLRDILVREEPLLLKPGQLYVLAALGGCILFIGLLHDYRLPVEQAAAAAICVTLLLRLLAIRFNWTTTPVTAWSSHLRLPGTRPHRDPEQPPRDG